MAIDTRSPRVPRSESALAPPVVLPTLQLKPKVIEDYEHHPGARPRKVRCATDSARWWVARASLVIGVVEADIFAQIRPTPSDRSL